MTAPPEIHLPQSPRLARLYNNAWEAARDAFAAGWQPRTIREAIEAALWLKYVPPGAGGLPSAASILDAVLARQEPSGRIPPAWDGGAELLPLFPALNPPLLSWAEWDLFHHTADEERVARVLTPLALHADWYSTERTRPDGHAWCAPEEAWQAGFRADAWAWADRTCQAGVDMECLAALALEAGQFDIAEASSANFLGFKELVRDTLWDDVTSGYMDLDEDGIPIGRLTAGTFWALLAGFAEGRQLEETLRHLLSPRTFGRSMAVPWLPANDDAFAEEGAPLAGAVYPLESYALLRAMDRQGEAEFAHEAAVDWLDAAAGAAGGTALHPAWYAPRTAAPGRDAPTCFHAAAGLGPVAMLIERVLCIAVDAPVERIVWAPRLLEDHGIRGLRCGGAAVDLYAEWRNRGWDVRATASDEPVELQVTGPSGTHVLDLQPGQDRQARVE